jgi:broad specificity phosphatase PhoE
MPVCVEYGKRKSSERKLQRSMTQDATTVALLIRHAHTNALGRQLCGRAPGVPLSLAGEAQALRLGVALSTVELAAIYTSPLERAVATARAIARRQHAATVELCEDLLECDFGEWTGRSFADLDGDPAWQGFNTGRATAVVPGGESAAAVQRRIVSGLAGLAARHAGQTFAVVSHADVLRSAVLHYTSTPLDLYDRFTVDPASVSAVSFTPAGPQLLYVNDRSFAECR